MIIGIDLRCLPVDGKAGAGVAHAARFLTLELLASDVSWEWKLYVPKGVNFSMEERRAHSVIELRDASGSSLRSALQSDPCDLLFVPGGSIAPRVPVRSIPWVHDIAIFDHPEWFPQSFLRRKLTTSLFVRGLKQAPIIFAVSDDTKRSLVRKFGLDPNRIIVTHEGGDLILSSFSDEELVERKMAAKKRIAALGISSSFILTLGTVEPRKNIAMLIQAWSDAKFEFGRAVDLVIAGGVGWKHKDVEISIGQFGATKAGDSQIRRISVLDDEERRDLLLAADLVALPSLHEGFGLVVLEAMQAGTALIASNAGAIPEVTGSDMLLLDPKDVGAWSKALTNLMKDDQARSRIAHAGKVHSKKFSWKKSAEVVAREIGKN
ncbi:MAG: glycosyltransferase family 1 protein [Patescibacteria group bacterium]|nr:glycosyltransferase family 4 protein [Patescibacteria group bacterium]MBU2508943.1 glycosyltransferase family 4 protein [Patescibacteria group bacterium]